MQRLFNRKIYYGWYIALSLAITETVAYGIMFYAIQVFVIPMEAELGWSRGQITGGISLSLLVAGLIAYPIGWWVDKYGARLLMTVGSIIATVLMLMWSQVTDLRMFYAIWFGMGVCGAMVFYEPAFAVIAAWFREKRSAALTVVTFAAGFASTIFLPFSDYLLVNFGWRQSVFILAIILGVTTIPLNALVLRRRPDDLGLLQDGVPKSASEKVSAPGLPVSAAVRSRFFWMLTLGFFIAGFGAAAVRVHFIQILVSIGVTSTSAAFAAASIGTMQVLGRVIFIPLDKHMSGRIMLTGLFAMQAIAILSMFTLSPLISVIVFVGFFGASVGMRTLVRPSILADTFGSANYGRISSVMALPLTLAGTAAPVVAGLMFDFFQNYDFLIMLTIGLSVLASVIIFFARPDSRKSVPV